MRQVPAQALLGSGVRGHGMVLVPSRIDHTAPRFSVAVVRRSNGWRLTRGGAIAFNYAEKLLAAVGCSRGLASANHTCLIVSSAVTTTETGVPLSNPGRNRHSLNAF